MKHFHSLVKTIYIRHDSQAKITGYLKLVLSVYKNTGEVIVCQGIGFFLIGPIHPVMEDNGGVKSVNLPPKLLSRQGGISS